MLIFRNLSPVATILPFVLQLQVTAGYTRLDRLLVRSLRLVVVVLLLGVLVVGEVAVAAASPAELASFVDLTTPRYQKGRPPPPVLAHPTTRSRTPILPTIRTARSSGHTRHTPIMDTSKSHRKSSSSPYLFR